MRPYSYRDDPDVPSFADDKPVIIFDGLCALCSGSASFVLRHDPHGVFRLHTGAVAARPRALCPLWPRPAGLRDDDPDPDGRAFDKSEAAIRIARASAFRGRSRPRLRIVPLALRDRLYAWVARNRIRWFGARTTCYRPEARFADRMID